MSTVSRIKRRLRAYNSPRKPRHNRWNVVYMTALMDFKVITKSEKDKIMEWLIGGDKDERHYD